MYEQVPRTVKVVDASTLVDLDGEARSRGFNRHHGPGWLTTHADMSAQHYLYPFMVHRAGHRPEFSPHWRCMLLLHMQDGQEVFSLLDIWPPTFMQIPESLTIQAKTELARRLEGERLPTQGPGKVLNEAEKCQRSGA
ncbi:hypothetical protein, partial [Actinoplanes utahensis]